MYSHFRKKRVHVPKQQKRGKNRKGSKLIAAKKTAAKPVIAITPAPFCWKVWAISLLPKDAATLVVMMHAFSTWLIAVEHFLTHLKL
jgi:hypothetical protein